MLHMSVDFPLSTFLQWFHITSDFAPSTKVIPTWLKVGLPHDEGILLPSSDSVDYNGSLYIHDPSLSGDGRYVCNFEAESKDVGKMSVIFTTSLLNFSPVSLKTTDGNFINIIFNVIV